MYPSTTDAKARDDRNAQLIMLQPSGWVTKIGHVHSADKRPEPQAVQTDSSGTQANQRLMREASTTRRASKRKECPTDMENDRNRARNMETSLETQMVHTSPEMSQDIHTTQSRPSVEDT
jgi:hypothetical protein